MVRDIPLGTTGNKNMNAQTDKHTTWEIISEPKKHDQTTLNTVDDHVPQNVIKISNKPSTKCTLTQSKKTNP